MQFIRTLFKSLQLSISNYWPEISIIVLVSIIGYTNFSSGSWLMGWDHYTPQLNFIKSLERSVFGVWQEDRGLGIPDGLSHAANLPHILMTGLLMLFIPDNYVRYFLHLSLYCFGMLGMYALIKEYVHTKSIAFISALFYGTNLATIQLFYLPLEAFSFHFAALPWLILLGKKYILKTKARDLLFFLGAAFCFSPQGYVPTLFIVFFVVFSLALFPLAYTQRKINFFIVLLSSLLISQLYWLLPYIVNFPTTLQKVSTTTINMLASPEVTLNNREYGTLVDVISGKGVYLSFLDTDTLQDFVMNPWIIETQSKTFLIHAVIFCILCLIGLFSQIKNFKNYGFIIITALFLILLATRQPGIQFITAFLENHIPAYSQAYRFTFTKFSLAFFFAYTFLIAQGLLYLQKTVKSNYINTFFALMIVVICLVSIAPAFTGNFFYKKLQVKIPNSYFQLQKFFNNQEDDQRILVLPQSEIWGWSYNSWGFRGSGFIWQLLKQPTLDGAFLPWHSNNERVYQEIETALATNNQVNLITTLTKYHIGWLVVDSSLIHTPLTAKNIIATLDTQAAFVKIDQFDTISIYKYSIPEQKNFITVPNEYTTSSSIPDFTSRDTIYNKNEEYISSNTPYQQYPFIFLTSKKSISDKIEYTTEGNTENTIKTDKLTLNQNGSYQITLSPSQKDFALIALEITTAENQTKFKFSYPYTLAADDTTLFDPLLHEITVDNPTTPVAVSINSTLIDLSEKQKSVKRYIFLPRLDTVDLNLYTLPDSISSNSTNTLDAKLFYSTKLNLVPVWKSYSEILNKKIAISSYTKHLTAHFFSQPITATGDTEEFSANCDPQQRGSMQLLKNENYIVVSAKDRAIACVNYGFPQASNDISYLLRIQAESQLGLPSQIAILNWITQTTQTQFMLLSGVNDSSYTILEEPSITGGGLSINTRTKSFLGTPSRILFDKITLYPAPLELLSDIRLLDSTQTISHKNTIKFKSISHAFPGFYQLVVNNESSTASPLILLQSYDHSWLAFKNFRLWEPLNHQEYSSWANVWMIDQGQQYITIINMAQFIYFFSLLVFVLIIILLLLKNKSLLKFVSTHSMVGFNVVHSNKTVVKIIRLLRLRLLGHS